MYLLICTLTLLLVFHFNTSYSSFFLYKRNFPDYLNRLKKIEIKWNLQNITNIKMFVEALICVSIFYSLIEVSNEQRRF